MTPLFIPVAAYMSAVQPPELSILLVTDTFETMAKVLACYADGIDRRRIEVVVSAMAGAGVSAERLQAEGFPLARVVDWADGVMHIAEARALGAATAPLVVFAQAHAYPRPGYVEAILAASRDSRWTVIGPSMAHANPTTGWSRAAMWINFSHWTDAPRGVMADVAGHNSAYRREAVLALGPDALGELLEAGWQLQVELCARGGCCFLEPAACVEITTPSRSASFLRAYWDLGRRSAAQRGRHWSRTRRFVYGCASPLVPFIRLSRLVRDGLSRRHAHRSWSLLPVMMLGLTASAAGEAVGYLVGQGTRSRFVHAD